MSSTFLKQSSFSEVRSLQHAQDPLLKHGLPYNTITVQQPDFKLVRNKLLLIKRLSQSISKRAPEHNLTPCMPRRQHQNPPNLYRKTELHERYPQSPSEGTKSPKIWICSTCTPHLDFRIKKPLLLSTMETDIDFHT